MKKYIIIVLLVISSVIHTQPGCCQVGNRLAAPGDSKSFVYVSCTCPCDQYEQLAKRQQCAECKHYPMAHAHTIEILTNIDIHKAHKAHQAYLRGLE